MVSLDERTEHTWEPEVEAGDGRHSVVRHVQGRSHSASGRDGRRV